MRKLNRIWITTATVACLTMWAGASSKLYAQRPDVHDHDVDHDQDRDHNEHAKLSVTSYPSGAHVSLDGVDSHEVTPMSTDVRIGPHKLTVSVPNSSWSTESLTVEVVPGQNDVTVTLLPNTVAGGIPGPQGPQGPAGPMGPPGAVGPQGPQGPIGNTGAQGPQGPAGPVGSAGPAGSQGPQGPIGNTGAQGPAGPMGSAGPAGPQGPQGPQGDTGPQGPTGPTGTVGGTGDLFVMGSPDTTNLPNSVGNPSVYFSPDVEPLNPGTLNDEFNGAALDTGRWTWHNQGGATATVSNSILFMTSPAHSGTNWEWITQPCPATPWTIQAKLKMFYPSFLNYANAGIVLSDGTKLITFSFSGQTAPVSFQVVHFDSETNFASTPYGGINYGFNEWMYMSVQDDGTNLHFMVSPDGVNWITLYSESRTAWLSGGPSLVGLGVDAEAGGALYMSVDWFRRTQ